MKTPTTQTRHFRSIISQPLLVLAFASVISALAMAPALAEAHDNRQGNWNHGRGNSGYHGKWHSYHGERHGYHHGERYGYPPPYYYRRPPHANAYIYAPPPVYYAPFPSPGINLVFPIEIR